MSLALGSGYWPDLLPYSPPIVDSDEPAIEDDPPLQIADADTVIAGAVPTNPTVSALNMAFQYIAGIPDRLARMPSRLPNMLHDPDGTEDPYNGNHGVIIVTTATPEGVQLPFAATALTWRAEPETSPFADQFVGMTTAQRGTEY